MAAIPTINGNGDYSQNDTQQRYKKYTNEPYQIRDSNENIAPWINVCPYCNLLIKHAINITILTIENGTGKFVLLVIVYTTTSLQCVPFVSQPLGQLTKHKPFNNE